MDYNPLVGTHTNFSKDCQPQTTLCEKPANYEEENLTVPRQLMPKRRENLCKSHHHQHSNYLWRATQKTEVLSNINRVKNRGSISRSLIPSFFSTKLRRIQKLTFLPYDFVHEYTIFSKPHGFFDSYNSDSFFSKVPVQKL